MRMLFGWSSKTHETDHFYEVYVKKSTDSLYTVNIVHWQQYLFIRESIFYLLPLPVRYCDDGTTALSGNDGSYVYIQASDILP